MTCRLILMRHAKSSWDDPDLADHDRPLNARGQRSANAMGDWLRAHGYLPKCAISSTSRRTAETFIGLGLDCDIRFTRDLYHATPDGMLDVLKTAPETPVLLIGHNPGIAAFAGLLMRRPPDHPRFADYPTGATLVADFDIPKWSDIDWHNGQVCDFVVPRELPRPAATDKP